MTKEMETLKRIESKLDGVVKTLEDITTVLEEMNEVLEYNEGQYDTLENGLRQLDQMFSEELLWS